MEIIKKESPNQSLRKGIKIDMIVIHATAGNSAENAVSWMCNPKSGVSAHYCIDRDGTVYQLVDESKKAWHAGKSSWWNGKVTEENLNENSIGIELVNLNNGKDPYPQAQLEALALIVADVQSFYKDITDNRIVGHGQIAHGRKTDPGNNFPWVQFGVLLERARKAFKATLGEK